MTIAIYHDRVDSEAFLPLAPLQPAGLFGLVTVLLLQTL